MGPPLRRRERDGFRCVTRLICGLIIVSLGMWIWTALVFMFFKNPSLTCPSCYCHCSHQDFLPVSCKFINYNSSVAEIDPKMIEEVRKERSMLMKEELDLVKKVSDENMKGYKMLMENAKKSSYQYRKEANKCNFGVTICEEGRERAQQQLLNELKLTALWQKRAHQMLLLQTQP